MAKSPKKVKIRTYNVGFGDCFLLSFDYGGSERHVLIDFGSTGLPEGVPATRMMDIANQIKERTKEGSLWARLVGSTIVGELADTAIFCVIAFGGVLSTSNLINYTVTGYVYKCLVEIACLPITYRVIRAIKKREPSYAAGVPASDPVGKSS